MKLHVGLGSSFIFLFQKDMQDIDLGIENEGWMAGLTGEGKSFAGKQVRTLPTLLPYFTG